MATDLEKFREKYPQYNDLSDKQVADNLHKSYPDYSKKDFYTKVGLKPKTFADKMEDFYSASGIHGANRGFSKIFGFGPHQQEMQANYEKAKKTHPYATEAGNISSQIASAIAAAGLGGVAAGLLPGIGAGAASYGGGILGAGGLGALETPGEGEGRMSNALTNMGVAAILPGAIPGIKALYGAAKKAPAVIKSLPTAISKEKIATKVADAAKGLKAKYSGPNGLFENFIGEAEKHGIKTDLPLTPRTTKIINKELKDVTKGARRAVVKAHKTNSVRDVMDAQSKLGKFKRSHYANARKPGGIVNQDAIDSSIYFENKLNEELERALAKQNPNLGEKLKGIRKGYLEEYVPFLENTEIQRFLSKGSAGNDLIKSLQGNTNAGKQFRGKLAKDFPEVKINEILNKALKYGLGTSGSLYAVDKVFGGK